MLTLWMEAFSGLGMFLFGMFYMETALQESVGFHFKRWVKNSTSSTFKSLITGTLATSLLQSSSAVTLITLSLVSVSMISLYSAIAIIFGANVGTTMTSWIVATLGFKVKIEAFALPFVGLGGLALIFFPSSKPITNVAKLFVGFGLLFLGLDFMKTAIESLTGSIDLTKFAHFPLTGFVLIGFVLTAIIQSSSAVTAIVLSALYTHLFTFEQSAALLIGSNIGTTVTAMLGSIGGIPDKKRVALAHFIFNFITAIVAFVILTPLIEFIMHFKVLSDDPVMALALFHTIFNLLGVILFLPFIARLARVLNKLFISKDAEATRYIHLVDPTFSETALVALHNEVNALFVKTMKFALLIANIKPTDIFIKKMNIKEAVETNQNTIPFNHITIYKSIKEIEMKIMEFVAVLYQQELKNEARENLDILLISVRESVYAAKILKDVKEDINEFTDSSNQIVHDLYDRIRRNLLYTMMIYINYMEEIWDKETCNEKFKKSKEENQQIIKVITTAISHPQMNDKRVVSLLNTNRSVYIASESLFEASKSVSLHFPLEE